MEGEMAKRLMEATSAADIQTTTRTLGNEMADDDAEALFAEIKGLNAPESGHSDEMLTAVSGALPQRYLDDFAVIFQEHGADKLR